MRKALIPLLCGAIFSAPAFSAPRPGAGSPRPTWATHDFGVLLLSHGGSSQWNETVGQVRDQLASQYPIEVALGMADPMEIQRACDRLNAKRVKKIVAVPLFVSSHSSVIDETAYVLGLRKKSSASFMAAAHAHRMDMPAHRVRSAAPIVMTSALDTHPIVSQILLDRARKMSRNPARESVVLVGHGPVEEKDNELWLRDMDKLARAVQTGGGFAGVYGATLRDDAPDKVRDAASAKLRSLVLNLSKKGKVLVVPDLISQGGIERHVRKALDGLFYEWTGETLLPDPRIAQWVDETARKGVGLPEAKTSENGKASPADKLKLTPMQGGY